MFDFFKKRRIKARYVKIIMERLDDVWVGTDGQSRVSYLGLEHAGENIIVDYYNITVSIDGHVVFKKWDQQLLKHIYHYLPEQVEKRKMKRLARQKRMDAEQSALAKFQELNKNT